MFKKCSISLIILQALLISLCFSPLLAQDTLYISDESGGSNYKVSSRDSSYADLKKKQLHLYGEATVESDDMNLKAGYIVVDMETNEVKATYLVDDKGEMIEKPIMTMNGDEVIANTLKYNLNTKKAYIEEVRIKQDEMYLHMGRAKLQANEEIHFVDGKFTTCDLEEPHYHFQLKRAVLVPDKRIATGPMNLYIAGIPTPLGLPFAILPQKKKDNDRTHGILFPEIVPTSQWGMGLGNLGYYFPVNENFQTSMYVTGYTRGSWGLRNYSEYAKIYGFQGNFDLRYNKFTQGFPNDMKRTDLRILWEHRQDPKANPKWNFNAKINFTSSNNTKNTLDLNNSDYFNNQLMSDVNVQRIFPGKPYQLQMKVGLSQNSSARTITTRLPVLNFSTSQFYPLKNLLKGEIFQRFGVIYSIEGQNTATFKDSLLTTGNFGGIAAQMMNGLQQRITLQTTGGIIKNTLKITPRISYNTNLNFQETRRYLDPNNPNVVLRDTLQRAGISHNLTASISMTTVMYNYFRFIGKNKPLLRHLMTPTISFNYVPSINRFITDNVGPNGALVTYNPHESSIYSSTYSKDQMLLSYSLNNTFELKRKSDKDTVTGFKKTRIIDALSLGGNYDFLRDSMNFSNIDVNIRISPVKWLNIVGGTVLSPYGWNDSTKRSTREFATVYNGNVFTGMRYHITTSVTLTSKQGREKLEKTKDQAALWGAEYRLYQLHPERIIDFDIPWKVTLSHLLDYTRNTQLLTDRDFNLVNTLNLDGDISFTKNWKLGASVKLDIKGMDVINGTFTLNRDLHCWALSVRWTPIGFYKNFMISIRNTSSLFKDAKLDIRKPPVF